jgi:uncharacterized protein YqhQ
MSQQESGPEDRTQYGGQAVVEGVMMRSKHYFAVSCRRPSTNAIVTRIEPIPASVQQFAWLNKPFLRGSLALVDAFGLGYRTLIYAANLQLADTGAAMTDEQLIEKATEAGEPGPDAKKSGTPPKRQPGQYAITGITIGLVSILALLFGYALFWLVPGVLSDAILFHHANHGVVLGVGEHSRLQTAGTRKTIGANLLEGFIRIAFFLGYLTLIARMKNVQRVFEYHGAEHKSINTLEAFEPLDAEHALKSSRIHPRCGTNFLFIVLITSVFVFSVIPRFSPADGILLYAGMHLLRLALLPVIAGISYEILRFAGTHRKQQWAQTMIAPGLWTQLLTTREPDAEQIECALAALQAVRARELGLDVAVGKSPIEPEKPADDIEPPATEIV